VVYYFVNLYNVRNIWYLYGSTDDDRMDHSWGVKKHIRRPRVVITLNPGPYSIWLQNYINGVRDAGTDPGVA